MKQVIETEYLVTKVEQIFNNINEQITNNDIAKGYTTQSIQEYAIYLENVQQKLDNTTEMQ